MSTAIAVAIHPRESALSDAERLGVEITELCSYIYAAQYRLLTLIREFDEQEYWAEMGLCSCAHWLNFKCGIGMNAAREKVRVAHALAGLPRISAAFERGAVSYSKVRAMTRVADASNEDYLLMIARHGTAHHVESLVSKFRVAGRLRDADAANERYESRDLAHYFDDDGCLVIKARMPAEQGAFVVKALEMAMERSHEVSHDDDVTAETSHLEDGPRVTAETSRRVACDSAVVSIKEDENGEPLSTGRRSRSIPPPMRRALINRDKGCRFPGCTTTRFVDGHHIRHWADGGETSLDNLVLLCRHHHHLVHEGGFSCDKDSSGNVVFRNRRLHKLDTIAPLQGLPRPEEFRGWLDRQFFEFDIDSETCTAAWHAGERTEWQMAVSAMFPR